MSAVRDALARAAATVDVPEDARRSQNLVRPKDLRKVRTGLHYKLGLEPAALRAAMPARALCTIAKILEDARGFDEDEVELAAWRILVAIGYWA